MIGALRRWSPPPDERHNPECPANFSGAVPRGWPGWPFLNRLCTAACRGRLRNRAGSGTCGSPFLFIPRGAGETAALLPQRSSALSNRIMRNYQLINRYYGNDRSVPNGDPRGFSGFPASSLPGPRFLPNVGPKSMISRDFLARGELRKIFYPEFSRAAGKPERRRYPALPASAPLGPSRPGTRGAKAVYWGVAVVAASAPAHKRFGEQPVWTEPKWATRALPDGSDRRHDQHGGIVE